MILGFMKRFPDGTKTNFVSKIMESLDPFPIQPTMPKHHTIRTDSKKRWKEGMKIHFCTGVRTKKMDCFDSGVCKSVQEVVMIFCTDELVDVFVDDKYLDSRQMIQLAINDGFESVTDFLKYFRPEAIQQKSYPIYGDFLPVYRGSLIHWTDLKY